MLIDLEMLKNKYNMKVDGVLHVGGHHGEEAEMYYKLKFSPVFWVEAETESVEILEKNVSIYPHHHVLQALVADEPKYLNFHHANNGQSSSILQFGTHSVEHPDVVFTGDVGMMATTIDELLDFDLISRCNLINLDIQGAELMALKGGVDFLETVDYLYLEVNEKELYQGGVMLPELDGWVGRFGFKRVETVMTPHGWGDGFYVRSPL